MFPDLEHYNTNDIRQILLYSWHFELFAVKESIEFTKKSLDDKISRLIKLAQENLMNQIYCDAMMKVQEYHNVEPIAYQSYLLTLYAIVEASLDRYCELCAERMNLKVKLEDFKDKGITRAVNYLEKCVGLDNIKSDIKWGRMQLINDMRNDFIHRAGYSTQLNKIRKYESELKVNIDNGKIYLSYEDVIRIYEYVEQFMEFVFTREFTTPNKTLIKKS